jgi:hypothetical protein
MLRITTLTLAVAAHLTILAADETPNPVVSVDSPLADSTYHIGQTLEIVWTAAPEYMDIGMTIDISTNGGQTWASLMPEDDPTIPNSDQRYEWTIPDSIDIYDRDSGRVITVSCVTDQIYLLLYEYDGETADTYVGPFAVAPASNAALRRAGRAGAINGSPNAPTGVVLHLCSPAPLPMGLVDLKGRRLPVSGSRRRLSTPSSARGIFLRIDR